ncbi:hypothetical protein [Enterococcus faecium]|uniref:hypothetical protein n=1 Tax=Enterococcus faecium TaxID=1352 RepID=UPI0021AD7A2D|nr:hypothetical protein [Enterococcus faecium]
MSDTYFNKMCQRIKAMNYSGIHFKYFIPISIAKKVEILYLPLTLASLANVVSILIDNKLR